MYNKDKVAELVARKLGDEYKVTAQEVTKTNGVVLDGICIIKEEEFYGPVIYLNENMHDWTDEEVSEYVLRAYENIGYSAEVDKAITSKEYILDNVFLALLNKEKNAELMTSCPFLEFEDLIYVPRVKVVNEKQEGSYLLTMRHLEGAGIEVAELMDNAVENTFADVIVTDLFEMFKDELDVAEPRVSMYAIRNSMGCYGAGCMINEDAFMQVAKELDSDLFIIPSSIHELILTQATDDVEHFKNMVREVNDTQLEDDEILSYNVYRFSKETGAISIA